MIIGIVGGIALAIGSFLNWATVSVNFDKIATALGIDPAQIPAGRPSAGHRERHRLEERGREVDARGRRRGRRSRRCS